MGHFSYFFYKPTPGKEVRFSSTKTPKNLPSVTRSMGKSAIISMFGNSKFLAREIIRNKSNGVKN